MNRTRMITNCRYRMLCDSLESGIRVNLCDLFAAAAATAATVRLATEKNKQRQKAEKRNESFAAN